MGNTVSGHFGHCENFNIYDAEDGKITAEEVVANPGHRPGFLPNFLADRGVQVIIAGGIGGGAKTALAQAGIQLYGGVTGSADQAVADLLADKLVFLPDVLCTHHGEGHGEGHSCGEHGCGGHSCGNHGA